jgi:hypothetical protein
VTLDSGDTARVSMEDEIWKGITRSVHAFYRDPNVGRPPPQITKM